MGRLARLSLVGMLSSLTPALVGAQSTDVPVAGLLPNMILNGARIAPGSQGDQADHFVGPAGSLTAVASLNRALALQVGSFPLGPTAMSVVFGEGAGAAGAARAVSSYTDGAATLGRGRKALAITYQDTTFNSLDGLDVRGSDINLFIGTACCSAVPSNRDLLQETVSLRVHRRVVGVVLSRGISDRLDVGVVIPFIEIAADARIESRILRTATAANPGIHEFNPIDLANRTIPGGGQPQVEGIVGSGNSTARGVGDVVLRSKYALWQTGVQHVAVGLDAKLPTGNADAFIGLGATQLTPAVMWSTAIARAAVRVRLQYTQSFGSLSSLLAAPGADLTVPNEFGYEVGVDVPVAPRTTLVADVVGRRVSGVSRFGVSDTVFSSRGPGSLPSSDFVGVNNLQDLGKSTVNLVLASVGARFYLGGPVFANARLLFPVGNTGLAPRPVGVFTFDYGF